MMGDGCPTDAGSSGNRYLLPLLLLLAVAVFFSPVFLRGHVISANDIAYQDPALLSVAPKGFHRPQNYLLADQYQQFYAYRTNFARNVRQGVWPLWNPYSLCGTSFAANISSQAYYPASLLSVVLPVPVADTIANILDLLIGGLGVVFLLRRFGAGTAATFFGALAFMFSSYTIHWLNHTHSTVAVYLPWMLWSVDRIIRENRIRGCDLAACAVVAALMIAGGHPGTMLNVFFATGAYMAFLSVPRLIRRGGRMATLGRVGVWAAGILLGIGVVAVELLPFFDMLYRESFTYASRAGMAAATAPLPLRSFLVALLPRAFGSSMTMDDTNIYSFIENAMFVGVTPLLLCAIALPRVLQRKEFSYFLLFSGAILLGIGGVWPFFQILPNIPLLRDSVFQRMAFLSQFGFAVCGALALDTWSRIPDRPTGVVRYWEPCVLAAVVVSTLALPFLGTGIPGKRLLAGTAIGVSLVILAGRRFPGLRSASSWLLGLILFAELFLAHRGINPLLPLHEALLPEPPLVANMKADARDHWFRIAAVDGTLVPNLSSVYEVRDVRGYELPMAQRYVDFLRTAFYDGAWHYGMIYWFNGPQMFAAENEPLLDLLGVRYVLKNGRSITRKSARGHAFLPRHVVSAAPEMAANLRLMRQNIAVAERKDLPEIDTATEGEVAVLHETVNGASVRVKTTSAAVLVFNEMPLQGWRARVDGKPSPVFPVNIVQLGVLLEPGEHLVEFSFLPVAFSRGGWISLAALVVMITLLVSRRAPLYLEVAGAKLCELCRWWPVRTVKGSKRKP